MNYSTLHLHAAGSVRRLIATAIDNFILTLLFINLSPYEGIPDIDTARQLFISWKFVGFFLAFTLGFYSFFITRFSATPGKMLTGLKVITVGGRSTKVSLAQAMIRTFFIGLSSIFYYIPLIELLIRRDRRHFADQLADTMVIQESQRFSLPSKRYIVAILIFIVSIVPLGERVRTLSQIAVSSKGITFTPVIHAEYFLDPLFEPQRFPKFIKASKLIL
jgi:uncharacterized RDD family membrane protein YckC